MISVLTVNFCSSDQVAGLAESLAACFRRRYFIRDLRRVNFVRGAADERRGYINYRETAQWAARQCFFDPLVTGLDVNLFPQAETRGHLHDWKIVLAPASTAQTMISEGPMDTNAVHRFRLEILH